MPLATRRAWRHAWQRRSRRAPRRLSINGVPTANAFLIRRRERTEGGARREDSNPPRA